MSYTKGPWKWEKPYEGSDYYNLVNPDGIQIHSDGSAAGEYSPDIDINGDDARLIAAAPDLLEACKKVLDGIRDHELSHDWPILEKEISILLTVIAEAEG